MIQRIEITRLRAGTLLRLSFVGLLLTIYPIVILAGIAAVFGADTMKVDNVPVHGWRAVLGMLLLPPFFAFVFSVFWLVATWPGLWLYSKFKGTDLSFYAPASDHSLRQSVAGGTPFPPP